MVCKDIIDAASVICQQASRAAHLQPATRPASEPAINPASPHPSSTVSSIWDLPPETDDSISIKPMLYSDAVYIAMVCTNFQQSVPHLESPEQTPDLLCNVTFPPLPTPRPAASAPRPATSTPRPATSAPRHAASAPRHAASAPRPTASAPRLCKENKYCNSNLRYKFSSNGTHYVQGKNDPLSNMWPVELCWGKYTFASSEHIYVFDMLKWHGKLNGTTLQMLLNCSTGFQAKKLGKKLVPQQSTSWFK